MEEGAPVRTTGVHVKDYKDYKEINDLHCRGSECIHKVDLHLMMLHSMYVGSRVPREKPLGQRKESTTNFQDVNPGHTGRRPVL